MSVSRLTKKQGYLYYPNNENDIFPDDGSNAIRLLQVIGQYENLEAELGIDLITLFKALKTNIWNEKTHRQEWVVLDYSNNEFVLKTTKELYIDDNKCILLLKDYGKTWALSRYELEEQDDE